MHLHFFNFHFTILRQVGLNYDCTMKNPSCVPMTLCSEVGNPNEVIYQNREVFECGNNVESMKRQCPLQLYHTFDYSRLWSHYWSFEIP